MTYKQIEKEFDECEHLETGMCDMNVAKSFFRQSFIKYLKDEVYRLKSKQPTPLYLHEGYRNSLRELEFNFYEDQITHITNQIRELEK